MASQTTELPVINTRRPELIERVERRYRRRSYKKKQKRKTAKRGLVGLIFQTLRVVAVLAVLVTGSSYLWLYNGLSDEQPDVSGVTSVIQPEQKSSGAQETRRAAEPKQNIEPGQVAQGGAEAKSQGGKTYRLAPAFTRHQATYERADSLIRPTRAFLTELEWLQKDIPPLQAYLQKEEDNLIFGQQQFQQGNGFRLVNMWQDRKDYNFPISKSELDTLSNNFEAAVKRMKDGRAKDDDAGTIIKTYEMSGKLLDLPLEDGLYLKTNIPAGPLAVWEDLRRINAEMYKADIPR